MKRDMDLVRDLLLRLEAIELPVGASTHITGKEPGLAVDGYSSEQIEYHLILLRDAGLVRTAGSQPAVGIGFTGLTWEGHDFLDAARNETVWQSTKKTILEKGGGMALEVVKAVLVETAKRYVLGQ